MLNVVAALILKEGKILLCRRPAHKARALKWEFVGGKVEPGESREEALVRECREELNIELSVGELLAQTVHQYPDLSVQLHLFLSRIREGIPQRLEHEEIRWVRPEDVGNYDLCEADRELWAQVDQRILQTPIL